MHDDTLLESLFTTTRGIVVDCQENPVVADNPWESNKYRSFVHVRRISILTKLDIKNN